MKTKTVLITMLALCFLLGGAGCDKETSNESLRIKDFSYLGCKETKGLRATLHGEEYIEYKAVADGYLHIKHVNAVFNCCPDTIKADVSMEDNIITINESETNPICDCICDYDLEYRLGPLTSGKEYILIFSRGAYVFSKLIIKYTPSLEGKIIVQY
ncbi:MAG TPA: hypothetical protein PK155_07055 [Bacteroidales bacterium]|nr:hypothetical protein [Bacteroidales bacterium]HQA93769.1 hypothetical protein [Bacteroidales bacterium]